MRYRVIISPAVQRQLRRITVSDRRRLEETLYRLADDPRPAASRKLRGYTGVWRIRVGRYRVIYEVLEEEVVIVILRVAARDDATYRGL
jgi:mRNA interferase RelE/StbE